MQILWDAFQDKLQNIPKEEHKRFLGLFLRVSALLNLPDIVKRLIEGECGDGTIPIDVNAVDKNLNTALIIAAENAHIEVVRLLLTRADINVNAQNSNMITALMFACDDGNIEIVKILLQINDININLIDSEQKSALAWACDGNHSEVINFLLQREELHMSQSNIMKVSKFVMNSDININDTKVVIEEAAIKNLPDIARWLISTQGYLLRVCSTQGLLSVRVKKTTSSKRLNTLNKK